MRQIDRGLTFWERIAAMKVWERQAVVTNSRGVSAKRRAMLMLSLGAGGIASSLARATGTAKRVTLYKEPQCGCCEGYAAYLRSNGFEVRIVPTHDLPLLDDQYGIPTDMQPCHLSMVDGYVIGGHVPIEAVNRLLTERPRITGISLPGMPLGSPGMNGEKRGPFRIYEIGKEPLKVYAII